MTVNIKTISISSVSNRTVSNIGVLISRVLILRVLIFKERCLWLIYWLLSGFSNFFIYYKKITLRYVYIQSIVLTRISLRRIQSRQTKVFNKPIDNLSPLMDK